MAEYVCRIDETRSDAMGNMPCERREEVVRCRDCAMFEHKAFGSPQGGYFRCWDYCNRWAEDVDPEGFCAWGRAKGGSNV